MRRWPLLSLRTLLTLPYVVLVLGLAGIVGALSYNAGREAVDELSGQLLTETVNRIAQAVDRHVAGSAAVLEAAFPKGTYAPESLEADTPLLRTRFWLATSVHRDPNNYAYYGDVKGRFFGLWRHSDTEAELRLRPSGEGPRQMHRFSGINGTLGEPTLETRIFDPRERPWFKAGQANTLHTWTSIYIDFKTEELVATRARRVTRPNGEFAGVVATDLSLRQVNAFLQKLPISKNGVAMVLEPGGNLIGVSRGPNLRAAAGGGQPGRLNAADSTEPLVAPTYQAVRALLAQQSQPHAPHTGVFSLPDGQLVQVGYAALRDTAGLEWQIMVAVPRRDFLQRVIDNFHNTVGLTLAAALGVVLIGMGVLTLVRRELRTLADAARRVGEGELAVPEGVGRPDELGELARSFAQMQQRLLTDKLTGLSNREAVLRRLEDRIHSHRRRGDGRPFAVMFADFNRFKQINDRFGHEVGDRVLQEMGHRLRQQVRAGDLVARYAGDEFLVVLDAVDNLREAELLRDKLEAALRAPLAALRGLTEEAPADGAAIGLAMYPGDGQDVQSLIHRADEDMYARKGRRLGA